MRHYDCFLPVVANVSLNMWRNFQKVDFNGKG